MNGEESASAAGREIVTRSAFLEAFRRRYDTMRLPASGQWVRFQSLSDAEMSAYEMAIWRRNEAGDLERDDEAVTQNRARLIVACLVDGDGRRLLADEDVEAVAGRDSADTLALGSRLRLHVGLDRTVSEEDAKKNASVNSSSGRG